MWLLLFLETIHKTVWSQKVVANPFCFVNIHNILILFKACSEKGFCGIYIYIYKNSFDLFLFGVSIFGSHIGIHCFGGFCFDGFCFCFVLFKFCFFFKIISHQGISGDIRGLQGSSGVIRVRGHHGPSGVIRGHQVISGDVLVFLVPIFFWKTNIFF